MWQGLTGFVGMLVAGVQAAANAIIDASVGSITLALAQAVTGVALWLQSLVVQVLALTRAATSFGSDLDSFYADFKFYRLQPTGSTGSVTFARFTPTLQAVVPIGALVSTGPGGLQFIVTLDTTNAAYNAGLGGYVLAPSVASVTVPVQCQTTGTTGNVLANTITSFVSPIVGVDTVTNGAAFTNGMAAETDPAFRARFPLYLAGLQGADEAAILSAIINTQQGLSYAYVDGYDYPGTTFDPGNFFVVVDDGSGTPPTALLTQVSLNILAVKGAGTRYQVYPPAVLVPTVSLSVRVAPGFVSGTVTNAVNAAVVNAVNAIEVQTGGNEALFVSYIEQAALAVPGCAAVKPGFTLINGTNADLALTVAQEPRIGSPQVTVGTY
jgi:uncharacterized phage protein gp47/JayE